MSDSPRPSRTELQLAELQLQAIDAFNRARRRTEQAAAAAPASREVRMDLDRELEVLRAGHVALVARTQEQLRCSVHVLQRAPSRRAVVAHRNAWFTGKLCTELTRHGVAVVGRFENGAQAVGVVVAEQPDLIVVEDRLAMLPGVEVVRQAREYVPESVIVAQVSYFDQVETMLQAGATAAYPRQVPPLDVSADLLRLVSGVPVAA